MLRPYDNRQGSDHCRRGADPQPYHLDEEAAHKSVFGGLAASGWHTAALSMRLLVDSEFRPAHGILGVGVDELRWLRPVRPGDSLYVETEVLEVRPSKSQADRGLIRMRTTTFNQSGEQVQMYVGNFSFRAGQPPAKCTAHVRAPRFSARKSGTRRK